VVLLSPPIIEKGMYLTDGERLYFVFNVKGNKVRLENCTTLSTHIRDIDTLSNWTEVKINK
jgi:hypothetical protein